VEERGEVHLDGLGELVPLGGCLGQVGEHVLDVVEVVVRAGWVRVDDAGGPQQALWKLGERARQC
jgi:hypothetical protein